MINWIMANLHVVIQVLSGEQYSWDLLPLEDVSSSAEEKTNELC